MKRPERVDTFTHVVAFGKFRPDPVRGWKTPTPGLHVIPQWKYLGHFSKREFQIIHAKSGKCVATHIKSLHKAQQIAEGLGRTGLGFTRPASWFAKNVHLKRYQKQLAHARRVAFGTLV